MRIAIFLPLLAMLTGCHPDSHYKTYTQLDPAADAGHVFVMALISREPQIEDKPDTALATFVLKPGQKETKTVGNKFYPERNYEFTTEVGTAPNGTAAVVVHTVVKERNVVLFNSSQQIDGWKVF